MSKHRRPVRPVVKIGLPEQVHTLRLSSDEYGLLDDFVQFWCEEDVADFIDDFIEFANAYRKRLYGDDWTPDLEWTPEKFDKVFDGLLEKHSQAGFFGRRDEN